VPASHLPPRTAAERSGTHLDAPIHFDAQGQKIERIPVDQTIGPAVVVDVTTKANVNREYQIGVEDFLAWEKSHGRLPDHSIVLLRTGYDRYWPRALKYLGTEERGEAAIPNTHLPGLAPEGLDGCPSSQKSRRWVWVNSSRQALCWWPCP
jgi:kynurenine formamidase